MYDNKEVNMAKFKNMEIFLNDKNYRLCEVIGGGGNACVWMAVVEGESIEYAVKFLIEDKDSKKIERFNREIKFCEENAHKNIVHIFGHGCFENRLYYIMPKYTKTLRDVIVTENNPINLLDYILQLCEGIKFAHDRKIIHRDIKPENILVNESGNLVLADFGIAHFDDTKLTITKDWLGNKGYAAPEQLIYGNIKNVNVACDIYAVGTIINELFTKEKPSGSQFVTISDVKPTLYPLDRLIYQCRSQNPEERPSIDEIILEIRLIKGKLQDSLEKIQKELRFEEDINLSHELVSKIVEKASEDILAAKFIFENATIEELNNYNCNYHMGIHYRIDTTLRNVYFQKILYNLCLRKFNIEAISYENGYKYTPLNLNIVDDQRRYKSLKEILEINQPDCQFEDLSGIILKLFSSCCDYHCDEILKDIQLIKQKVEDLEDAPIFYIMYKLRQEFSKKDARKINLQDHIFINWNETRYQASDCDSLYISNTFKGVEILMKFQKEWGVVYSKMDSQHYSVKFESKDRYNEFRDFALNIAKPYYEFEGDVLDLIKVKQEYYGVVELFPLDLFEITNVLAKILGKRNDY